MHVLTIHSRKDESAIVTASPHLAKAVVGVVGHDLVEVRDQFGEVLSLEEIEAFEAPSTKDLGAALENYRAARIAIR